MRFPGGLEERAVFFADVPGGKTVFGAERKGNFARIDAGVAKDAGARGRAFLPRQGQIAKFFVFVGGFAAF